MPPAADPAVEEPYRGGGPLAASPTVPGGEALVGIRRSSTFLPELESVRGIAVLLVFAFHADVFIRFPFIEPKSTLATAFVRAGYTGVDLFFLLSAFLLSLPFFVEAAGGRRVVLRDYFVRRTLRILPLFYSAVLVATVLCATELRDLAHGLPYLLFLNSFPNMTVPFDPYSGVWWSLATEVQFYLVLPLLLLFLRMRWGWLAGAAFIGAYALAYIAMVRGSLRMWTIVGQMAFINSVFGRGPLFLWGIFAAAVFQHAGGWLRERLAQRRWLRMGGADLLLLALILANAFFLRWLVSIGAVRQMSARDQAWHVVNGALWAAFLLLILLAPLRTKVLFSNRILGWLGILSYSIYMIHMPFMQRSLWGLRRAWPGHVDWGWTPLSFAVIVVLSAGCVALSAFTYRFIERPFLVRKARFDS